LSDGGNSDGKDPLHFVKTLKSLEPGMIFHTIMFGIDPTVAILKQEPLLDAYKTINHF
jgi:hypothetical protein